MYERIRFIVIRMYLLNIIESKRNFCIRNRRGINWLGLSRFYYY